MAAGTKSAKSKKKKSAPAGFSGKIADLSYEIPVGIVAVFFTFFFTHGLPFWGDDLSRWLPQARAGWLSILIHSERPLTLVLYKTLPYENVLFFLKALAIGGIAALLFQVLRSFKVKLFPALLALALFCTSLNVLAAGMHLSDMAPLSELVLLGTLLWAWKHVDRPEPLEGRERKIFYAVFFSAVFFGSKLQGDARLAPLVLAAYLALFRKQRLRELAPFLGASFLASLPWSLTMFSHGGFSVFGAFGRAFSFLVGADLFSLSPVSLAAGLVWLLFPALGYAAYRHSLGKLSAPKKEWAFFLVWLALAALVSGFGSEGEGQDPVSIGLALWVPATVLLGLLLDRAFKDFGKKPVIRHALLGLIAVQCLTGISREYSYRRTLGREMIAESEARKLARRMGGSVLISWNSSLDPRVRLERAARGCANTAFDHLFPCAPGEAILLLRSVGAPPELARAEELDRRGDFEDARSIAYAAWARDPRNHGAGFVAAQYAQRAGDYAKMEKIYDEIGPYFPATPTVLYNWGLAKEAVGKYSESSNLLQKAYSLTHDATVGYGLAELYHREGKRGRALATVNQLLQLYPESSSMKDTYNFWSTH